MFRPFPYKELNKALKKAKIAEKPITERFRVVLPYSIHSDFERELRKAGGEIITAEYGDKVELVYDTPVAQKAILEEQLANISRGEIKVERINLE